MYIAHINSDGATQTCTEHSINTANLTENFLSETNLGATGYLAGILHDCGKFTDEFSDYIKRAVNGEKVHKGEVIHSFAAVRLLLNKYHSLSETPNENKQMQLLTSEIIASAVGGHHGLYDCVDTESNSGFEHRISKQPKYDDMAINNFFNECIKEKSINELFGKSAIEIGNIIQKLIPISKNETELKFYISLLTRLLTSALVDSDRYDTAAFMNGEPTAEDTVVPWNETLENLEKYLNKLSQDTPIGSARKDISELCLKAGNIQPGLFRLNVPTGGGKTLSSLRFALNHAKFHNKKRIILISPLLSILDQNSKTVRNALQSDKIILEHHSNVIRENENEKNYNLYTYMTETWNSPIIITTLVQFLNTLFSGKMSSVRRYHALTDSIIVIDEIQTVPNKMLSLFNLAVNFLTQICSATVVLCSATQPNLGTIEHSLNQNITDIIPNSVLKKYDKVFKRTQITDKGYMTENEIVDFALETLNDHQSLLIVCNKKKEAESLYNNLQGCNARCFHLSAGMCQEHRNNTLAEMYQALTNREKVLCVATQVIESGVDISFNAVIRYAAGIDSIVQAAGRCNRNGESRISAPTYIVNLKDENLSKLKEIEIAKTATEKLLYNFSEQPENFDNDISSDRSVSSYYEYLYSEFKNKYHDYQMTQKGLPSIFSMLSSNIDFISAKYDYLMAQAFKTAGESFEALDSEQISVIVPYGNGEELAEEITVMCCNGTDDSEIFSMIKKTTPYSVSIPHYQLDLYRKQGAITELLCGKIIIINKAFYDENIGILTERKENCECNTLIL